jgi:fluoride exporter
MSALTLLAIGAIGGVGAVSRFLVDGIIAGRFGREFPFGTLAVNLSGTLALGILVGAAVSDDALRLVGTGLLGSYTTFSTWALESHRLGEDGQRAAGALNFAASLVLGVGIAWIAQEIGTAL